MAQEQTKNTRRVQDELGAVYAMPIRMYGVVEESIVDGPGLRFSAFVQGCSHHCPGCHNRESQLHEGGYLSTVGELCERIANNASVSGVTLTGGEPFEQPEACLALARWCKTRGLSVWAYSGYCYEGILAGNVPGHKSQACRGNAARCAARALLDVCDVLVDGPFVMEKRSYDLHWKGSSNQRVIDLVETRRLGCMVLWRDEIMDFAAPENW